MATGEPKASRRVLNVATAVFVLAALVVVVVVVTRSTSLPLPPASDQTLVFSPSGSTAYVPVGGQIDVERLTPGGSTTTAVIAIPGGTVTHEVISPDGHELVVATAAPAPTRNGSVSTVNLTASPAQVRQVYQGNTIDSLAMAPGGTFALIGEGGRLAAAPPGTVDRLNLDTASPSVVARAQVGFGIAGLAVASNGRNAFVLNHGLQQGPQQLTTLRISARSIGVLGSVAVSGSGLVLGVGPTGGTAYVGGSVVDVFTEPPTLLAPPTPPSGLANLDGYTAQSITPDGRFIYLSGGVATGATQVVEDTSTAPPTAVSFALTNCTDAQVNPRGTTVSCGAALSYPVVPSVTSVALPQGGAAGGYTVTLHGDRLANATQVLFGPTVAPIDTDSAKGDSIKVAVPAGTLGPVPISVTTPGGSNPPAPAATFLYTAAPAVSGITPSRGLIQGGTGVLLAGSGFTSNSIVDFGPGNQATVIKVSPSGAFLAVRAPAGSGTVSITVSNGQGVSTPTGADRYRFVKQAPVVDAVYPRTGSSKGGYGLLIGGHKLNAATAIYFGSTLAKKVSQSTDGDYLAVIVPPGDGTVDITVTTPSGTSADVGGDQFTYSS